MKLYTISTSFPLLKACLYGPFISETGVTIDFIGINIWVPFLSFFNQEFRELRNVRYIVHTFR